MLHNLARRRRHEQFRDFRRIVELGVQPGRLMFAGNDERRPIVDVVHRRIGFADDDGAGFDLLPVAYPAALEAGEREQRIVGRVEEPGLLALRPCLPLVPAFGRNQAASLSERLAEARTGRDVFDARVEGAELHDRLLGPVRQ